MLPKLNTLSLLCALALFFAPWLDVRCSDRPVITQSGFQTATASYSLSPELQERSGDDTEKRIESDDEPRHALLAAGALVCTTLAALVALAGLMGGSRGGRVFPAGLLAGLALALLLVQNSRGFPVDLDLRQKPGEDPGSAIAHAMVSSAIEVRRTPWFYATLGALGFAALLGLNALVDGGKGRR